MSDQNSTRLRPLLFLSEPGEERGWCTDNFEKHKIFYNFCLKYNSVNIFLSNIQGRPEGGASEAVAPGAGDRGAPRLGGEIFFYK